MDSSRFDAWTRRRFGLAVGGFAAALLGLTPGTDTDAKKKRKRKKPQLNAFGCLDIGKACGGNGSKCCSGICQGKKAKKGKQDKSRCVAHNTGGCSTGLSACAGVEAPCGEAGGVCFQTTGKGAFCSVATAGSCQICRTDADCAALGFGAGSACLVCEALCGDTGGTACSPPAA
jgi:hypothetical protein